MNKTQLTSGKTSRKNIQPDVKTQTQTLPIDDKSDKSDKSDKTIDKSKRKLTLKSMNVIATWEYDVENTQCTLCHHDLMSPFCMTNNIHLQLHQNQHQNQPKYDNDVCIGTCKHGFHASCINSWIKHGNSVCPKCKTQWKISKNGTSSVFVYKTE